MKILVTGCAGFLGFHLVNNILLNSKKIKVVGVDNINNYYSVLLKKKRLNILKKKKNFRFIKNDISNYKSLSKVFKKNKFHYVINLAAQAGVRYSIDNPKEYVDSNIVGFFNIAELCRINKIKKIFYASSSSVYGEKKTFPLKENLDIDPKNIYSLSKKNNEEIAEIYSRYYGLSFVGLRLFTIYGEWGRPDMLIIKYILAAIKRKKFYLNNYGDHYRDFTYVDDVVKNIIQLTKKKLLLKNQIINVCNGKTVSLKYVLRKLNKAFGSPKIQKRSKQIADVYKTHGDNSKLKKITNIKNYTTIDQGLKKIISWVENNKQFLKRL